MASKINRRSFAKRFLYPSVAAVMAPLAGAVQSAVLTQGDMPSVIGETRYGRIRGVRQRGVNIFKGVPYAGQVSGARRFLPATALQPWSGVLDTVAPGAPSIQPPRRGELAPAEDCLFLNVWTPANDNRKRPVMFYNHGGGFVIGSGAAAGQDGANLARHFDVVVVQTNHRLGLLGFLYLDEIAGGEYVGSGNRGLGDIVEGLRWVKENIAAFGGDPDNVMIFGESGGGAKTSCLYAMPSAAPYFNKASIESGPGVRMKSRADAAATTEYVLEQLGIAPSDWKQLLEIPSQRLLEIQQSLPFVPPSLGKQPNKGVQLGFGPVVDGGVLPHHPFDPNAPSVSADKPLLVGWNEDEYTFFAWQQRDASLATMDDATMLSRLRGQFGEDAEQIVATYRRANPDATPAQLFIAVTSIDMMGLGSIEIAERKVEQQRAPVYLYNFGYKTEMTIPGTDFPMGTPHAMDISFKFNNEVPPLEGETPAPSFGGQRSERYVASHHFAALWTSFARTGVPAAENVPEWRAYNLEQRPTMRIDSRCEIINDRYAEELAMWRSLGRL